MSINPAQLLEAVVLESLGNHLYLKRLKEKFGIVTQWGSASWLILQQLEENGAYTVEQLADTRLVTVSYEQGLLDELEESALVSNNDGVYDITEDGKHVLQKLRDIVAADLEPYVTRFDPAELETALKVLVQLRSVASEILHQ